MWSGASITTPRTSWSTLAGYIETLRRYITSLSPLSKPLPAISSITSPKTETEAADDLTLYPLGQRLGGKDG